MVVLVRGWSGEPCASAHELLWYTTAALTERPQVWNAPRQYLYLESTREWFLLEPPVYWGEHSYGHYERLYSAAQYSIDIDIDECLMLERPASCWQEIWQQALWWLGPAATRPPNALTLTWSAVQPPSAQLTLYHGRVRKQRV